MAIQHLLSVSKPLAMKIRLVQLMRRRKRTPLPCRRDWVSLVLSLYRHPRMGAGLVSSLEKAIDELQLYVNGSRRKKEGRHECFQTITTVGEM